jgi:leader peptidase (prepilin peptidase)/N-methyltransferase
MHWQPLTTAVAAVALGAAGAMVGRPLIAAALRQLGIKRPMSQSQAVRCRAAVAAGGLVAVVAAHRTGTTLYLPALAVWGLVLSALAAGDALTLRIATPMCRQAILAVALLVAVAAVATRDWRGLGLTIASSFCANMILSECARFTGVGDGDRRLAALGGLGLGHGTWLGLLAGLVALIAVVGIQVALRSRRKLHPMTTQCGDFNSKRMPLGPALTIGFLVCGSI